MKRIILITFVAAVIAVGVFAFTNIAEKNETVDQTVSSAIKPAANDNSHNEVLKRGQFINADSFHKGRGTAEVVKTNQGNILKFSSDFNVTKGPDLFVYFSKTADEIEKDPGDFVSLGRIQNTSGEQTYKLPDNLEGYKSVVVWCRAFKTTFTVAPLR